MKLLVKETQHGIWYEGGTVYYYSPRLIENALIRESAQEMIQGASLSSLFYRFERDDRPKLWIELELMLLISTCVLSFLEMVVKGSAIRRRRVELLD